MIELVVVVTIICAFGLAALACAGIVVVLSGCFDDDDLARQKAEAHERLARRQLYPYPKGVESSVRDWESAS